MRKSGTASPEIQEGKRSALEEEENHAARPPLQQSVSSFRTLSSPSTPALSRSSSQTFSSSCDDEEERLTPSLFRKIFRSTSSLVVDHRRASTKELGNGLDVDLSTILIYPRSRDASFSGSAGTSSTPSSGPTPSSTYLISSAESDEGIDSLFLHQYSAKHLIDVFQKTGIISALGSLGYMSPFIVFDTSDDFQHRLSLVDPSLLSAPLSPSNLSADRFLIDLFIKRRNGWGKGNHTLSCYQSNERLIKAGSWEALREMTSEIRAPYVGLEGAREASKFLQDSVESLSKLAKGGNDELVVSEIAWMQVSRHA